MKLPVLTLCLSFVTAMASADALKTDFDALFMLYSSNTKTVSHNGRPAEELTLPGNVTVRRSLSITDDAVLAFDRSGKGAVGCAMKLTLNLRAVTQTCSNVGSVEARGHMDGLIDQLVEYYAENNFPRRSPYDVRRAVESRIAAMSDQMNPQICKTDHIKEVSKMVNALAATDAVAQMDELLATPRLPAVNPCL